MMIPKANQNEYFKYKMCDSRKEAVEYQHKNGGYICSGLEGSPTKEVFDGILDTFGIKIDDEIHYFIHPFMVFKPTVEEINK